MLLRVEQFDRIYVDTYLTFEDKTNCRRAAATICPRLSPAPVGALRRRADGDVAAVTHGRANVLAMAHGQHVPTPTAEVTSCAGGRHNMLPPSAS